MPHGQRREVALEIEIALGAHADIEADRLARAMGESGLDDALNALKGKTAQGREVVVKRDVKLEQVSYCHIVYVSSSEKARISKILTEAGKGVLTVSDLPAFTDAGGIIGLTVSDNKVGFDVNLAAAQQADLKISAQLLKVARGVRGKAKS